MERFVNVTKDRTRAVRLNITCTGQICRGTHLSVPGFAFLFGKAAAEDDDDGIFSAETTKNTEAAEQEALAELGVLLETKNEADKKFAGASLESMLAGMELSLIHI